MKCYLDSVCEPTFPISDCGCPKTADSLAAGLLQLAGRPSVRCAAGDVLYMYAVPRALPQHEGVTFDGKIVYQDHEVPVPADSVDDPFIQKFAELIRRLSSPTPARRVASAAECRFCPISSTDCPERLPNLEVEVKTTDDF